MNYRHAFHAGNFADVFKHVILTRILVYLARKDAAFRMIDTHAGEGIYDLSAAAAEKTLEWRNGIGRLVGADAPPKIQALLAPYLAVVAPYLAAEVPSYPGSPALACRLLRRQDRMIFCDARSEVVAALRARPEFSRDRRVKIAGIDGYVALNAFLPPVERRGVVLIDPPYEMATEFDRLAGALGTAAHKWPTGIYMVWFPIKDRARVDGFLAALVSTMEHAGVTKVLHLELQVDVPRPDGPLAANGLVILNPPFPLEVEARALLPYLARSMAIASDSGADIAWLIRD